MTTQHVARTRFRTRLALVRLGSVGLLLAAAGFPSSVHAQESSPLARVEALGLDTAHVGRVTVYFAPADRDRAVELGALADAAAAFFEREHLPFLHGGGHGTMAMAFPADDAMVLYMTQSRWGRHRAAFANRLLMSGIFDHPGLSFDFATMQWANPQNVAALELSRTQQGNYIGTYAAGGELDDTSEVLRVLENDTVLMLRKGVPGSKTDLWFHLVPTGNHRFRMGRYKDGRLVAIDDRHEIRFEVADGAATVLELIKDDRVVISARRAQ
jgi:hypothetical protein